jgi:hypothetical protein
MQPVMKPILSFTAKQVIIVELTILQATYTNHFTQSHFEHWISQETSDSQNLNLSRSKSNDKQPNHIK